MDDLFGDGTFGALGGGMGGGPRGPEWHGGGHHGGGGGGRDRTRAGVGRPKGGGMGGGCGAWWQAPCLGWLRCLAGAGLEAGLGAGISQSIYSRIWIERVSGLGSRECS